MAVYNPYEFTQELVDVGRLMIYVRQKNVNTYEYVELNINDSM